MRLRLKDKLLIANRIKRYASHSCHSHSADPFVLLLSAKAAMPHAEVKGVLYDTLFFGPFDSGQVIIPPAVVGLHQQVVRIDTYISA